MLVCAPPLAFSAELEEIVVTARAVEESIRDIPVSITALREERLDHFALETFDDLEALTPQLRICLLYTSPSPRDATLSRMPSSA